jgi:hypothetical protein
VLLGTCHCHAPAHPVQLRIRPDVQPVVRHVSAGDPDAAPAPLVAAEHCTSHPIERTSQTSLFSYPGVQPGWPHPDDAPRRCRHCPHTHRLLRLLAVAARLFHGLRVGGTAAGAAFWLSPSWHTPSCACLMCCGTPFVAVRPQPAARPEGTLMQWCMLSGRCRQIARAAWNGEIDYNIHTGE